MGGNNRGRKRRFGTIRKLPSGNFQVRYPGQDGILRTAETTFPTETDAQDYLVQLEAEMLRGEWLDPDAGKVSIKEFAERWIAERDLSARSRENYTGYLRNHINPHIGSLMLVEVSPGRIRTWRKGLLDDGTGESTVAKCYRFLHAVMATAADDELIKRNPCRIRGAGVEKSPERPIATLAEVFAIAANIQPRYRLLVLLAAFAQLRYGELLALQRGDITLPPRREPRAEEVEAGVAPSELIDDGFGVLRVDRAITQLDSGEKLVKGPKSEAGHRTVNLPGAILPDVRRHLRTDGFTDPGESGRLFRGPKGATPTRQNFNRVWKAALRKASANPKLHLHDLRHTGGTLTAQTGATLKEIMSRIGHSSTRAALLYQHATSERDRRIAQALDAVIEEARRTAEGATERRPVTLETEE
jgi:integrase